MRKPDQPLQIVLVHPQIPQNTGNIGRFCVATGCKLALIHPLGFELSEKNLRRAGLDYWQHLQVDEYPNWQAWQEKNKEARPAFMTKKATKDLRELSKGEYNAFVFGCESTGLPEEILQGAENQSFCIPIWDQRVRSYNLSNAVAMTAMHVLLC
jgi:tRNA (cytidine/uridine-2'-O-)-methyltransferase